GGRAGAGPPSYTLPAWGLGSSVIPLVPRLRLGTRTARLCLARRGRGGSAPRQGLGARRPDRYTPAPTGPVAGPPLCVTVESVATCCEVRGGGLPLVFLHGLGSTGNVWNAQRVALS